MPARRRGNSSPSSSAASTIRSAASTIAAGVGGDEHRRVADQLHQPHRRLGHRGRQLVEATGDQAQLFGLDLLAELGEADQVGEADRDVGRRPRLPRGDVGGADHVAADLLEHVGAEGVGEGRLEDRQHVLGGGGEAQRQVALGVARLHQRADDQLAVGLGDPRRRHADRPRHLQHPLLGQAGVEEGLDPPRRLEVGLGQRALVGVRIGDADGGAWRAAEVAGRRPTFSATSRGV